MTKHQQEKAGEGRCGGTGYIPGEDPPPPGFSTPVPISLNCPGCPDCRAERESTYFGCDLPPAPEPRRWKLWVVPELGQGSGATGPSTSPPDDCGLTGTDWTRAAEVEVMPVSEHEAYVEAVEQSRRLLSTDRSQLTDSGGAGGDAA